MYESFLTIPDAPDYEINSELVIRDKKSGYVLKPYFKYRNSPYYTLRGRGSRKTVTRSAKHLYRQAVGATQKRFLPVPSLNYRYEISSRGTLRNSKTKKTIKLIKGAFKVTVSPKKHVSVSRADLLWEVHGIVIKRRNKVVPCFAENAHGKFFFRSSIECARFLAPKIFYSTRYIVNWLCKRKTLIGGWEITYVDLYCADIKWNMRGLSRIARRQQKLDEQSCKN